MGAIDLSGLGGLLQYGVSGFVVAGAVLLLSLLVYLFRQLDKVEKAKEAAVDAERNRIAADDERKDKRIKQLAEENERLEQALDEERARRRAAEDGRAP